MDGRGLRAHKKTIKRLPSKDIVFGKGARLKSPLNDVIRSKSRTSTTKLIRVSDRHFACFLWRDGDVRVRSAFYGWLLHQNTAGGLVAIASLHYHPSHKPAHLVTPCNKLDNEDWHALGAGCSELMLNDVEYDPRDEHDRTLLIERFCAAVGIEIINGDTYDAPASQVLDLRPLPR